ncbi:MAG: nitronate monooxygenase [Actinomycetota bacterium]
MLRTELCETYGIQHPIVQAGMGPFGSGGELAATVSNAGAIGTLGGSARPLDELRAELAKIHELTNRPFVVNFTQPYLQQVPEAFDIALEASPPVVSMALGDPGDLVQRAHDAGALFMQQVHTVEQAALVAGRGVDAIIAQGTEAGGFTGRIAMQVLVPQVVDAVSPIPVIAAGGIADGRGLAAALVLGAEGVNVGTRFLASDESSISPAWKQALVEARPEDAVKAEVWDAVFPKPGGGAFDVVPRSLRTAFIESWATRLGEANDEADRLGAEIGSAVSENRMEDFVPFTGQVVGLIDAILPAAQIVHDMVADAEDILRKTAMR